MKKVIFFIYFIPLFGLAQNMTILKGTVKNVNEQPIEGVSISYGNLGTSQIKEENIKSEFLTKKKLQ